MKMHGLRPGNALPGISIFPRQLKSALFMSGVLSSSMDRYVCMHSMHDTDITDTDITDTALTDSTDSLTCDAEWPWPVTWWAPQHRQHSGVIIINRPGEEAASNVHRVVLHAAPYMNHRNHRCVSMQR